MQVTLRRALPEDAEELSAVAAQTFADGWSAVIGEEAAATYGAVCLNPEVFSKEIAATETSTILVAVDPESKAILGYTKLDFARIAPQEVTGTNPAVLQRLYVIAAARGKGVADTLLQSAIETAIQHGRHTLWLECDPRNERATRFYEKRDFRVVGKTVYHYPGGFNDQVVIMECSVSPSAP